MCSVVALALADQVTQVQCRILHLRIGVVSEFVCDVLDWAYSFQLVDYFVGRQRRVDVVVQLDESD